MSVVAMSTNALTRSHAPTPSRMSVCRNRVKKSHMSARPRPRLHAPDLIATLLPLRSHHDGTGCFELVSHASCILARRHRSSRGEHKQSPPATSCVCECLFSHRIESGQETMRQHSPAGARTASPSADVHAKRSLVGQRADPSRQAATSTPPLCCCRRRKTITLSCLYEGVRSASRTRTRRVASAEVALFSPALRRGCKATRTKFRLARALRLSYLYW